MNVESYFTLELVASHTNKNKLIFVCFLDRRNKMDKHGCLLIYLIMIDIRRFITIWLGAENNKDHAICQDLFNNTFIICKLIKIKAQECFRQIATIVWDHDFSAALYIICDFPISENECKIVITLRSYFFMSI